MALSNLWPDENVAHMLSWHAFTSIDFIGGVSLLCGCGFLVFALQQAGSQALAWDSLAIILSFIVSGVSCLIFAGWETYLAHKRYRHVEPIFPIELMKRRPYAAGLL